MIDCHVHSDCSGDCKTPLLEMCRAAVANGVTTICFTEHIDFEPTDSCYQTFDYEHYNRCIEEARLAFGGLIDIRSAVEVDFQAKFAMEIKNLLDNTKFDYVLGAAHYVDGVILEDHQRYFAGKSADAAYLPYLENTLAAVESGWFDALAHLDLCKRYGVRYYGLFDWSRYSDLIERILVGVIEREMALEINTSGLRQSPGDTYPSAEIIQLYASLGGKLVTAGSDAHRPEHIGAGVDTAVSIARMTGFTGVATYKGRRLSLIPVT